MNHLAPWVCLITLSTSAIGCVSPLGRPPPDPDTPRVRVTPAPKLERAADPTEPTQLPVPMRSPQQLVSAGAPRWIAEFAGADSEPTATLFGVGHTDNLHYAKARAVHNLDAAWRSFIRLVDWELYGADPVRSGRLPLPAWSDTGDAREGVLFANQWSARGDLFFRAQVSLDKVLAPLAEIAKTNDLKAVGQKVHARLVKRQTHGTMDWPFAEPLAVTQVAMGLTHACAVLADQTVACWGAGEMGQLGVQVNESHATIPRRVPQLRNIKQVAIGGQTSCALTNAGDVYCWGNAFFGHLGSAFRIDTSLPAKRRYSSTPIAVKGLSQIVEISLSTEHACALDREGRAYCWGSGDHGALGFLVQNEKPAADAAKATNATPPQPIQLLPRQVPGLEKVLHIAAGQMRTCVVTSNGRVLCFGYMHGGFGTAQVPNDPCGVGCSFAPIELPGIKDAENMVLGDGFGCAKHTDGTVSCWGPSAAVRLTRDDCNRDCSAKPIAGLTKIRSLSAGPHVVCAVSESGETTCWGRGEVLEDPEVPTKPTLMKVPANVTDISVGFSACVVTNAKGLSCWGRNLGGEIGDGTTLPLHTPYRVHEFGTTKPK